MKGTGFDSILVRLKVKRQRNAEPKRQRFRFHTGSIKRDSSHYTPQVGEQSFDSILVRLKASKIITLTTWFISFDSILVRLKGDSPCAASPCTFAFRFHTGSIKRSPVLLSVILRLRFDSILVRLKAGYWASWCYRYWCFDSILVRLKVKHALFVVVVKGFRFHTGSIKSAIRRPCERRRYSFDSILVRLKEDTGSLYLHCDPSFDSILVRLKEQYWHRLSRHPNQVSIPYWFD